MTQRHRYGSVSITGIKQGEEENENEALKGEVEGKSEHGFELLYGHVASSDHLPSRLEQVKGGPNRRSRNINLNAGAFPLRIQAYV